MPAERIRVEGVIKLFGERAHEGLDLLRKGAGKDAIRERSGAVLGLDNVSFTVEEGEILVVMGLSGSGKSTMLRCLNRLVEPTAGSIRVDGVEVTTLGSKALREFRRQTFGMVFQHFALFPNRTIAENVEYGLEVQGVAPAERRRRALESIELVGLRGWDAKLPSQLSGGMQQRAGLARALCVDADILLMDEAFSALDPLIRREMQDELVSLQRNLRKTVVFVSHDLDEAIHLGGRIVLMRDGAIVQAGSAEEILLAPADDYVRRFAEHIDVSSVLTLGRLVDETPPLLPESLHAEDAWPLVETRAPDEVLVVTCDRHMPVGRVSRDRLGAPGARGRRLDALMDGGIARARSTDVLRTVLPLLAREPLGIAVVDEHNRFLGLLTRERVLHALARTRPGDGEWNGSTPAPGAFPSSHSTRSATTVSTGLPLTFPA
ncbi:quaternary amine ABC transporter ATP-binding protein [Aureimonas jatrophae]|uniref:Quaternary amine transport ATP-binding protein n=1 Tax=Aureimonas jatrophae TaxID=1166073 RepID=A0A1H0ISF4_9HYPH|nr:glycine betaine/L-proline ABC transporter ATP-binding protein [Aureimonas jatrophae]MBB3952336.1 glycine betaine/proline transport system ATP-binding protein [Aureimonas jatrophae]SDO34368.1 glycine betaine/proline transport system ATP-binding protein [Aureimonas jatrophae]